MGKYNSLEIGDVIEIKAGHGLFSDEFSNFWRIHKFGPKVTTTDGSAKIPVSIIRVNLDGVCGDDEHEHFYIDKIYLHNFFYVLDTPHVEFAIANFETPWHRKEHHLLALSFKLSNAGLFSMRFFMEGFFEFTKIEHTDGMYLEYSDDKMIGIMDSGKAVGTISEDDLISRIKKKFHTSKSDVVKIAFSNIKHEKTKHLAYVFVQDNNSKLKSMKTPLNDGLDWYLVVRKEHDGESSSFKKSGSVLNQVDKQFADKKVKNRGIISNESLGNRACMCLLSQEDAEAIRKEDNIERVEILL